MSRVVLVVAAHADDEALGCGGTIARHTADGDSVHLLLIADGVTSRLNVNPDDLMCRDKASEKASEILGIKTSYRLGLPDNRLDSIPLLDIVRELEIIIKKIMPRVIYTHHHGDLNVDHRRTQEAVMTACRPQPGCPVKEIYGFEVPSSTEWATPYRAPFLPSVFVDISDYLLTKKSAIEAYTEEMRPEPHSRSMGHVLALAAHRGYTVGVKAAEAFMVYRLIR